MKAMVLNEYGDNAQFQSAEIEQPEATQGHVIVEVAACSVNTVDTMIRQMGKDLPLSPDLPAVLGMDFAGMIVEVGDGVEGFEAGDEVFGCAGGLATLQGSLAQFMAADAGLIAKKPARLSMREAAALPLVGITAFEGLQRAKAGSGQKLLVHGGAGGVGHVAVQLAKYFGADVFATVGSESDTKIVEGYGATAINFRNQAVQDYVDQHTSGVGFDVVFDSVGGANMAKSFEAAALNANIATTVSLLELDLTPAHFKGLSIHVVFMLIPMLYDVHREDHGQILASLARIVDQGALTPLVDETRFSMHDAGAAYDHLATGQATGKVVIEMT